MRLGLFRRVVSHTRVAAVLALVLMGAVLTPARAAGPAGGKNDPPKKKKELQWTSLYKVASIQAHKDNRLILALFTGSDWGEWDHKLQEDVLQTDLFREWAEKNCVPLVIDFPRGKNLSADLKEQNERLKLKYNIGKIPTLLFLDPDGDIVARAGYDEAKLREDEHQGQPLAWLKFCADAVTNRPPMESIIEQKGLIEGMAYAKKHFVCLVILVSNKQGQTPFYAKRKTDLLHNQPFVKFVNRNLAFLQLDWPEDTDTSPNANAWRDFATKFKISKESPQRLVFWDFGYDKIMTQISAFDTFDTDPLITILTRNLPHPDYGGEWLTNFPTALAIAMTQKKPLFIYFTEPESEYCQKFDTEIIKDADHKFKEYSRKSLVLVKVEFPRDPELQKQQPAPLREQNQHMAELYGIRGYPWVILLNYQGQRIGESKYQKGGPVPFLGEVDNVVKEDLKRLKPGL